MLKKAKHAVLLFFLATMAAMSGENPWDYWQTHDASSQTLINHKIWDALTSKYVVPDSDGINLFDYGSVSTTEREQLENYIANLEAIQVTGLNTEEQKTYWINLYNAVTVKLVLDNYPVDSIRNISPGLFSRGPWKEKLLTIESKKLSLDDIEHRILRPIFADNRIHYALNCASIGCPNLQPQAFTSGNLESLLEQGAHDYVNHPRGVRIENGELVVSSIYHWFKEDFGNSDDGVIKHLKRYAAADLKKALDNANAIADHEYDWSLNDARE